MFAPTANMVVRVDRPTAFLLRGETTWTEIHLERLAALVAQVGERRLMVFLPADCVHRVEVLLSPLRLALLWLRLCLLRRRVVRWGWCLLGRERGGLRVTLAAISQQRLEQLLRPLHVAGTKIVRASPLPLVGGEAAEVGAETGWPPGVAGLPNLLPDVRRTLVLVALVALALGTALVFYLDSASVSPVAPAAPVPNPVASVAVEQPAGDAFELLPLLAQITADSGHVRLNRYEWSQDGTFELDGWASDSNRVTACARQLEALPGVTAVSIARSEFAGGGERSRGDLAIDFTIRGRAR